MSHPESDGIVVAGDNLTVSKRLDRKRFEHLGVVYDIRSDRGEAVDLRLTDTVPESIPVGFHPRYHGSDWSMDDRTVVFERTLEPGEELTTLYGLGTGAADSTDRFRSEPTVEYRPAGHGEYVRLDPKTEPVDPQEQDEPGSPSGSSSISELASSLETMDLDVESGSAEGSGLEPNRSAGTRIPPDSREDVSALQEAIDELEGIVDELPSNPSEQLESETERQAVGFHIEAIRFHIAHLREDLTGSCGSSEPETKIDPPGAAEPTTESPAEESETAPQAEETKPAEPPAPDSAGSAASTDAETGVMDDRSALSRIGRGIPFFWIVAFLAMGVSILGLGVVNGSGRDRLLVGIGGFVAAISAFGWVYPEEKLPLAVMLLLVAAGGLAIVIHPFLFGTPSSMTGIGTIIAGVLITSIPMVVENRRGQLLGMLRN